MASDSPRRIKLFPELFKERVLKWGRLNLGNYDEVSHRIISLQLENNIRNWFIRLEKSVCKCYNIDYKDEVTIVN